MGKDNVTVHSARLPIPYGVHHSKLSIFEGSDDRIHVMVSTANLLEGDWCRKTQMFYYVSAVIEQEEVAGEEQPELARDLNNYLKCYKLDEHLQYWMDRLKYARFEATSDRLIYSYPGYFQQMMNKVGHRSLRVALAKHCEKNESWVAEGRKKLMLCQSSSIGSLGSKVETWLTGEFLRSLRGGREESEKQRLFVIFPTNEDVHGSIEGVLAGGSLPYRRDTHNKQEWLRARMAKWRSERLGRSRVMPHVKSYTQMDSETRLPDWQVVTSANLSKAAWGDEQKDGTQIMIRSYEVGVLIVDRDRIRLPFDYPISVYKPGDTPWFVDDLP